MLDKISVLEDLKTLVKQFTQDRDWQQFHSPKNLSQALSIEANELMEIFLWCNDDASKLTLEKKRDNVEQELADVFWWLLQLSWQYNIDLSTALKNKMELNEKRYPIDKAKGNTLKYSELTSNDRNRI